MTRVLDLRTIPEARWDASVANLLAVLQEGESFTVVSGVDPKPLFENLKIGVPAGVQLDYLEAGPQSWRVRVTKVSRGTDENSGCCGGGCGGS